MSRMIDADALKGRIDKCVALSGIGLEPLMAVQDIKALISVMPDIDAIPVEWLEKQASEEGPYSIYCQAALEILLDDWKKEQEV